MGKRPKRQTNFKIGDLIRLNNFGMLIQLTQDQVNIGIIASEPYIFVKTVCESTTLEDTAFMELEDWCYDILLGSEVVKMMPESFLEFIIEEDTEEE